MSQDDNELDKLSKKKKEENETGENDMSVMEKELKDMQQLQQKKLTREEIRKAMIKQTIRKNYDALQRLSRT